MENDANHLVFLGGCSTNVPASTNTFPSTAVLLVDLYGGTSAGTMTLQTTTTMSASSPGRFGPVNFISPNLPAGQTATMQIQIRESGYATAYNAQASGGFYGFSQIFTMNPSGSLAYNSITNASGTALSTWANGSVSCGAAGWGAVDVAPWPGPPSVVSLFLSRPYVLGTNVTLGVILEGTLPLILQWRKNGIAVTGANPAFDFSSFTLTNLTLMDAGNYDVVVTNCLGSKTWHVATVQVLPPNAPSIEVNNWVAVGTVTSSVPANVSITGGFSGGTVFYTLDGSPPTTNSTSYTGAFSISNSCTLRAMGASADFSQTSEAPPINVVFASSPFAGGQLRNPRKVGADFVCDLDGAAFRAFQVQVSSNLLNWSDLLVITNSTGRVSFTNTMDDMGHYYRAYLLP